MLSITGPDFAPLAVRLDGAFADVSLSKRGRRVAELLGRGCSHKQIADQLDVSMGTVASYGHRIFRKLNVQGRVELARALGG